MTVTIGRSFLMLAFIVGAFQWQRYMIVAHAFGRYGKDRLLALADALYGVMLVWGGVLYFGVLMTPWSPSGDDIRSFLIWVLPYLMAYPPSRLLWDTHHTANQAQKLIV